MNQNIRIASVTCSIPNTGTTSGDEVFENIPGQIIGFSTKTIKGDDEAALKVAIKENDNEVVRPMHPAFSETTGRSSFFHGLVPVKVTNPSRMTAVVTSNKATRNEVIVEVIVAYKHNDQC